MGTRPRPSIKDIRDIDNIMALVTREAQALESRLERDLASRCSNYQQLLILKKNQGNEKGIQSASSCAGMTPRERLIWYQLCRDPDVESGPLRLGNFLVNARAQQTRERNKKSVHCKHLRALAATDRIGSKARTRLDI